MTDKGFDPKDHMMQLKGKDYLPVFARILWLRTEQSGATLETEMVEHEVGKHATFKAKVTLADGASATGWGTETVGDFRDYLEKSETKAIGRALGALGYGTAAADFTYEKDEPTTKVVDSPIERQTPPLRSRLVDEAQQKGATVVETRTAPSPPAPNDTAPKGTMTPAQRSAIFAIGRGLSMESEEVETLCKTKFQDRRIGSLSKEEASAFIEELKSIGRTKAQVAS